jgi:hypothetical protein
MATRRRNRKGKKEIFIFINRPEELHVRIIMREPYAPEVEWARPLKCSTNKRVERSSCSAARVIVCAASLAFSL